MKKSIFTIVILITIACFSLLTAGCSNENEYNQEQNSKKLEENLINRTTQIEYDEFRPLFDDIYNGDYSFGVQKNYRDEGEIYIVRAVLNETGTIIKGYFVYAPSKNDPETTDLVFIEHVAFNKILNTYHNNGGTFIITTADLSLDLEYDRLGINPETPTSQYAEKRRFWGWTKPKDIKWHDCAPDGTQLATIVHYVFGVANATKQISRACQ